MSTIKNAFKKGIMQGIGLAIAFTGSTVLLAATVAGTVNTFTTGDLLDAAKINENFTSLKTAVEAINPQESTSVEVATDRRWIDGRIIYRKVVNVGTLPNSTLTLSPHGITFSALLDISGYANDGTTHISLPYASSVANQNLAVAADATNVSVTTNFNWSAYSGFVVLTYVK